MSATAEPIPRGRRVETKLDPEVYERYLALARKNHRKIADQLRASVELDLERDEEERT